MPTRIAVIYYSATGNVHRLASAVADGARDAGAEVRLRRAGEGHFDDRRLSRSPPSMTSSGPMATPSARRPATASPRGR